MNKYVIKGLGEMFDGLLVLGEEELIDGHNYLLVERIEQPSELFTTFSVPVYSGLLIDIDKLEKWESVNTEYMTDNPYGKHKSEGKISDDNVDIIWALYSRALTVVIKNVEKTLYSFVFYDQIAIRRVHEFIRDLEFDEQYDIHDAIFDIRSFEL